MFKKFILSLIVLLMLTLACANPIGKPAQTENVETVVAATFQALTQTAPQDSSSSLLPHSIYFLKSDGAQFTQVFKLDKDGKTVTQLTFEPTHVEDYDVSQVDGSVVFISNNQLLTVNADGSNRSMIVDGGKLDEINPFVNKVSSPVWSPNGETIAFGYKGLNFYSIVSGQSNLALENLIEDQGNGAVFPRELVWPEAYSADGSKLLLTLGYYEGASAAIYYPNGGAVVRLQGEQRAVICCDNLKWTPDGSAFYSASSTYGMFAAGLWRVDASNGNVSTLLLGDFDSNPVHSASSPILATDGNLYFFYATLPAGQDIVSRVPLQIVRSAPDGVTNRTVLRPETYELMNEALWSSDGSFVVAAIAPNPDIYIGGEAKLIYTDGQKGIVSLTSFAQNMKWGP